MLNRGFTLIEVLVSLVILMFGLLGIAGLMAKGQRVSFEAYQRQQGLAIANDMAERMRANRTQAPAYATAAPAAAPLGKRTLYDSLPKDCGAPATNCTITELATYDLAKWDGLLNGYTERAGVALIGGIMGAGGCIVDTTVAAVPGCPAPTGVMVNRNYRVSVAWQGNEDTVAPPAPPVGSACGAGNYGAETRRRVVSLDLLLQVCP